MRNVERKWWMALVAAGFLAGPAMAAGGGGDFGLGVILGAPTGFSGAYWLDSQKAIDGALAWHLGHEDHLQIHSDFLWHFPISAQVPNGAMAFYVGGGLRVIAGDDAEAGIRIPLGLNYRFNQAPVELFAEIVPVLEFAPDTDGELDGGVGIRYYFKTSR